MDIRQPSVAGLFYPADSGALRREIGGYLGAVDRTPRRRPKAIVAPHAGTIYSGPVAAYGYAAVRPFAAQITRVVLLAPAHRLYFEGLALPDVDCFRTPLGTIPVDRQAVATAREQPGTRQLDPAFDDEHAIEVQLPFLQEVLDDFSLVPVVVGRADEKDVATLLEALWGGDETLIVVSSDLSHYLDYQSARQRDAVTRASIEGLHAERLEGEDACGFLPLRGLLLVAQRKGLHVETLDMRNSGDTAGPRDRVVGYGSYVVYP